MPNFPRDFIYAAQPLDNPYICYAIRGHVSQEQDKVYYWPQMKRIYDVLQPLIKDWVVKRLDSDQKLDRDYGGSYWDDAYRHIMRQAPGCGLQTLTETNLEIVTTRYLADNAHLIARFAGKSDALFFTKDHPECVVFGQHEIMAQRKPVRFAKKQVFQLLPHDLHITVGGAAHQHATQLSDPINQAIDMYVCRDVVGAEAGDQLARAMGEIAQAKHIWRAESGFAGSLHVDAEGQSRPRFNVRDIYEEAVDGKNRFGSTWVDMM